MFAVKLGREMIDVENTRLDLKETFDPGSPKGMLGLVKDLVAMANSGGGIVAFGRTETDTPGIDEVLVEQLDSARVMDQVNKFVAPATASIGKSAITSSRLPTTCEKLNGLSSRSNLNVQCETISCAAIG